MGWMGEGNTCSMMLVPAPGSFIVALLVLFLLPLRTEPNPVCLNQFSESGFFITIQESVNLASTLASQDLLHGFVIHVFLSHIPFQVTLTKSKEPREPTHFTTQHLASTDDIACILLPLVSDSEHVDRHCSWDVNPIACNQKGIR